MTTWIHHTSWHHACSTMSRTHEACVRPGGSGWVWTWRPPSLPCAWSMIISGDRIPGACEAKWGQRGAMRKPQATQPDVSKLLEALPARQQLQALLQGSSASVCLLCCLPHNLLLAASSCLEVPIKTRMSRLAQVSHCKRQWVESNVCPWQ